MITIPSTTKQYLQANTTDLFGNVYITKNISFRKKGYIKLNSRVIAVASEKLDSNFRLPLSFGRQNGGAFFVCTANKNYLANLAPASFSITPEVGFAAPTNSFDSVGCWWQNIWHVTLDTALWYRAPNGNWFTTFVALTSGVVHDLEIFRTRGTMCISNGNTVIQINPDYTTTNQFALTIPSDYEITNIAFNTDRLGVATKLSDAAAGQNQNAFFYVWDGKSVGANGGYDTGSDMVVVAIPYGSQWVVITRTGQALLFNGSGFADAPLFTLPFFFENIIWGDSINRQAVADMFTVEGDNIHINLPTSLNLFGPNGETYLENYPGGMLCYDPLVGLYNEYGPSASMAYDLIVASGGIDTSTGIFSESGGTTIPITGNPVKYINSPNTPIGGLVPYAVYYIIRIDDTDFKLAATRADALAGIFITPTSTGASTNNFLAIDVVDYGVPYSNGRTGGVVLPNEHKQTYDHLVFGAEIPDFDSQTVYGFMNVTIPGFRNIGYVVSPKLTSSQITDMINKIWTKYKTLDVNDKIIVKFKNEKVLGLPMTTPETSGVICTWVDSKTFTVRYDLAFIETYLGDEEKQCEVEIISGAGAGQMSQITDISEVGGLYTIVLEDEIEGVIPGRSCNIKIDNWKFIEMATVDDTLGWKEFSVDRDSKWGMFKLILDGVNIELEEQDIINKIETPAE